MHVSKRVQFSELFSRGTVETSKFSPVLLCYLFYNMKYTVTSRPWEIKIYLPLSFSVVYIGTYQKYHALLMSLCPLFWDFRVTNAFRKFYQYVTHTDSVQKRECQIIRARALNIYMANKKNSMLSDIQVLFLKSLF